MPTKEQRQTTRMPLTSLGTAIINSKSIPFHTRNISFGGCCVEIEIDHPLQVGMTIQINMPSLEIAGDAIVRWLSTASDTLMAGLEFQVLIPITESTS